MNVTEIPGQIKEQLASVAEIAKAHVGGTIEWVREHGAGMLPRPVTELRNKLPEATHVIDVSFDAVDSFLRSQRERATKLANAIAPKPASVAA